MPITEVHLLSLLFSLNIILIIIFIVVTVKAHKGPKTAIFQINLNTLLSTFKETRCLGMISLCLYSTYCQLISYYGKISGLSCAD